MPIRHTPGPWGRNIPPAAKYPIIYSGHAPRHQHVVQILSRGLPDSEVEGNADLVAAAPDMREALADIMQRIAPHKGTDVLLERCYDIAFKALAGAGALP